MVFFKQWTVNSEQCDMIPRSAMQGSRQIQHPSSSVSPDLMAPKRSKRRPTKRCALSTVQSAKHKPWNKGKKMSKTDLQHLFIPREDLLLFLAVSLYFAGPRYVMALWITMVTSRRISEALQLQALDVFLDGGHMQDAPHIRFQKREENKAFQGMGKLGADCIAARLAPDVVSTLREVMDKGVRRCVLPPLEPFRKSHPHVFRDFQPRSSKAFDWPLDSGYLFPAQTKKAKQPWMARQTVWQAVTHVGKLMFALTGRRRWNVRFKGSHVTVHGATRHTASALLLSNPEDAKRPSEHVIMEIQQRLDVGTFRRHYCHAHEEDVAKALENASVQVRFAMPNEDPEAMPPNQDPEPVVHSPSTADATDPVPCPLSTFAVGPEDLALAEVSSSQDTVKSHASRNAWRQKKRKAGKKAWAAQAHQVSPDRDRN